MCPHPHTQINKSVVFKKEIQSELGMLVLACNPSTWEAEEGCNLRPASVTEGDFEFEGWGNL